MDSQTLPKSAGHLVGILALGVWCALIALPKSVDASPAKAQAQRMNQYRPNVAPRPRPNAAQRSSVQRPNVTPRPIAQRSAEELNAILFRAAELSNLTLMENVLAQGADPNFSNHLGETPLHAAAANGNLAGLQLLVRQGANVNALTIKSWTPLHSAARFGHAQIVALLNRHGTPINIRNSDGKTALGLAETARKPQAAHVISMLGGR